MPTQAEIAEHLDLNQSEVSRLVAELSIDWRNESMTRIRVEYIRRLRAMAAGHRSASGDDLVAERVQTERVDRALKELALAEKRKQLVNVEQLEPELTQMVVAFRTEVLSLALNIKSTLDALYGIDIDQQVLTDLTHDALDQLSRYDPERAVTGAAAGDAGGAAGADDHDGMGAPASTSQPEVDGQARALQPRLDAVGGGDAPGAGRPGGVEDRVPEVGTSRVD